MRPSLAKGGFEKMFRSLPFNEKYRGAFILRMAGLTLKETGDVLGLSAERVRTTQHIVERVLNVTAQHRERELWRMTSREWYGRSVPFENKTARDERRST
jgi:hypothetical protein